MKSDIIETSGKTILDQGQFDFYTISEHGIEFKKNTPQETWLSVVEQLTKMFESSHRLHIRTMFLLGDALTFGEAEYGELYAQGIDMTRKVMQLSEKSIKNAAWICSSINPSIRRETLTFAHHEAVAALPENEQSQFLDQAESENLTVSGLKKAIKAVHPTTKRGKQRKTGQAKIEITDIDQAKAVAKELSDFLLDYEGDIKALKPMLEHFHKLYRRQWQNGRKR